MTTAIEQFPGLLADNVRIFLQIKSAYEQCDPEIRETIDDLMKICMDSEADADEKDRAVNTIVEALFPSLAVDMQQFEEAICSSKEGRALNATMEEEETTFAQRVQELMAKKRITQEELAKRIGVGQPAISKMLNRECRPQRQTVSRIAEALDVAPADLWPNF